MQHQKQTDIVARLETKAAKIQLEALGAPFDPTCTITTHPMAELLQEAANEIRRQREGITLLANELNELQFQLPRIID